MNLVKSLVESVERLGTGTAIDTGVQIALRARQLNLVVVEAAQTVSNGRNTLAQHGGIRNDKRIGFELFFIFLDEIPEADPANFFFAFDEDLHVAGELAVPLLQGSHRFQLDVDLAFVVSGT